jgi:hypothetical protein
MGPSASQPPGPPSDDRATRSVAIRGEMIRLGQFLKLAGLAESGGDARALIAAGGGDSARVAAAG